MSRQRYASYEATERLMGPTGRPICLQCGTNECLGRRTSFCSNACSEAYWIRRSGRMLRGATFQRDHGICRQCGLDTVKLERLRDRALAISWMDVLFYNCHQPASWKALTSREREIPRFRDPVIREAMILAAPLKSRFMRAWEYAANRANIPAWARRKRISLWIADHILPVFEGGGECGLENIQTLCVVCSAQKTADEAGRRGRRPKSRWHTAF